MAEGLVKPARTATFLQEVVRCAEGNAATEASTYDLYDTPNANLNDLPSKIHLTDHLVFRLKTESHNIKLQELYKRFPDDFDANGDIRPQRQSIGPAVVIMALGIPWYPVYRGYYALGGDRLARYTPLLKTKSSSAALGLQNLHAFRVGRIYRIEKEYTGQNKK